MTELIIFTVLVLIWTGILRLIRKLVPGALPSLSNAALRSFLRSRLFGPKHTFRHAGIQPGWRVLEVGPGWGYLTREAIREVGPTGEIICLDISPEMLQRCREHLAEAGTPVHYLLADGSAIPLDDASCDAALLVSVVGEVGDKAAMMREVARCLRPGARAWVTEILLHPDYIYPWTLRRIAAEGDMRVIATYGHLLCHTTELAPAAHAEVTAAAGPCTIAGETGS